MVRITRNKIKIEVFVPLGSCACNFAPFMEKVGHVASKFKDSVEIQMKSTGSSEASKYGVQDMCLVVNGKIKLPSDFDEKKLEKAILISGQPTPQTSAANSRPVKPAMITM